MHVERYISSLISTWEKVNKADLAECVKFVQNSLSFGRGIMVAGNGGSSATASHFVVDWSKGFLHNSAQSSPIISLTDNTPLITAIANDISYEQIFSFQLARFGKKGDLLVCISGSGNSKNLIEACLKAKELGMTIVTLTGFDGGKILRFADYSFHCPISDMQVVEDMHASFGHMVIRCQQF
jgi:D-sedoheptulose 7-phosphate isomerase